jgi:hypothetical protein
MLPKPFMPFWKLQTVSAQRLEFLYENREDEKRSLSVRQDAV